MNEVYLTWSTMETTAQDRAQWRQLVSGMLHYRSDKGISQLSQVSAKQAQQTLAPHCRVLPPGDLNCVNLEPLPVQAYSESSVLPQAYCCNGREHRNNETENNTSSARQYKKLSCSKQVARCFVSLNISLSLEMTSLNRARHVQVLYSINLSFIVSASA